MIRRLMIVSGHHYGSALGGSENTIDELCVVLTRSGIVSAVAAPARATQQEPLTRTPRSAYVLYLAAELAESLPQAVADFGPDAVLATVDLRPKLIDALCGLQKPLAIYLQDVLGSGPLRTRYPQDSSVMYLANSAFTATRAKVHWGLDATVIPPIILSERYRVEGGARRGVLFVNPIAFKGIEIAYALARHRPDILFRFQESWRVSATWRESQKPRALAAGNILWAYPVTDMRPVYAGARLLLAPSVAEEGWGRVVTEAQFSGIPALASDRGALPSTVGQGGVIVPLHAPIEEWFAAFDRIWNDPGFYAQLSRGALSRAADPDLKPEAISRRLIDVLSEHADRWNRERSAAAT